VYVRLSRGGGAVEQAHNVSLVQSLASQLCMTWYIAHPHGARGSKAKGCPSCAYLTQSCRAGFRDTSADVRCAVRCRAHTLGTRMAGAALCASLHAAAYASQHRCHALLHLLTARGFDDAICVRYLGPDCIHYIRSCYLKPPSALHPAAWLGPWATLLPQAQPYR
jgi:hypothetical protein